MLINFITECASIIKISNLTSCSSSLINEAYSIKSSTDIKSWKLMNDSVSSTTFTFMSTDVKKLKNIDYNLVGSIQNGDIAITIETSLDYVNWNELQYKASNKYLYKTFSVSGQTFYFNTQTNAITSLSDIYANQETTPEYVFSYVNSYSNVTEYLYVNLEWKYLRMTLSNIPATNSNPLYFTNFEIYIDEDFDVDKIDNNLLELRSTMFTKSKMFEDYTLYPDLITNYLKMIEEKNAKFDNMNYATSVITIDDFTESEGVEGDLIQFDNEIY